MEHALAKAHLKVPKEAIDAVMNALVAHKPFDQQRKHEFATMVLQEIFYVKGLGEEIDNQVKNHQQLKRKLKAAQTAMANLLDETGKSFDGSYINSITAQELRKRYNVDVSGYLFEEYINTYAQMLARHKPMARKSGPKNSSAFVVARTIAQLYQSILGEDPAFTSPDPNDPKQTVYVRICEAVGLIFKINITAHMQKRAVQFVKINSKHKETAISPQC